MPDIKEDLAIKILKRLPPKSLIRFRSVSKSWCSLIDSPLFIRIHALHSVKFPQKAIIIHYGILSIRNNNDGVILNTFKSQNSYIGERLQNSGFHINGSCNGILLMRNFLGDPSIILWNPSIRRQLRVPNHPCSHSAYQSAIGFCYEPITDDYKILSLPRSKEASSQRSFIYSMKTNSWSEIVSPTISFSYVNIQKFSVVCYVNGMLHWVVKDKLDKYVAYYYILTFDLATHVFGMISLPKPSWGTTQVTSSKGSLAVISSDGSDTKIWIRREYDNVASWFKAFNVRSCVFQGVDGLFQVNRQDVEDSLAEFEGYNCETGEELWFGAFSDSYFSVELGMRVESLELLGNEVCENG